MYGALPRMLPPSQIVPDLLDKGIYMASESTFYRVLSEVGQLHHRGQSRTPQRRHEPTRPMGLVKSGVGILLITHQRYGAVLLSLPV